VAAETDVKAAKRGVWAGTFQKPTDYRKAQRSGGEDPTPAAVASGGCPIKGKILAKGDKIYHVLGTRDYNWTLVSENSGERMFCSEDEGKAAGWRTPRG
jgi:hypothetical protein